MATTASITVEFGGSDSEILTAELDEVRNVGNTSFQPGDVVYFRVYATVPYDDPIISSGVVSLELPDDTLDIAGEVVSFLGSVSTSVSKLITSILSYTWYDSNGGNNYGAIDILSPNEVFAQTADEDSVGVASISYTTTFDVWKITPPVDMPSKYHISVLIRGTE